MTINTYLSTLATSLVLSEEEKDKINKSIETLKLRLSYYFSDVVEKKVFGSYERVTILPRRADSNSDVDLMVVFSNPNNHKPQSFLNRLKSFVENYYSKSEIYQSSPTIVLELNHIKFELVPAQKVYSSYYIPNGPSEWMYTNPNGLSTDALEANRDNSYRLKPVIRLLKLWNIHHNSRAFTSYYLEKRLVEQLKYAYFSCSSYLDYVKTAFTELKALADRVSSTRIDAALVYISVAEQYEKEGKSNDALSWIKDVFPEV